MVWVKRTMLLPRCTKCGPCHASRARGGRVVGGAVGRWWGQCCELQQLWVEVSYRYRGIGTHSPDSLRAELVKKRRPHRPRILNSALRHCTSPPEGDLWSGAASDGVLSGVASWFAPFPCGIPLRRAMNPWPMPAASLKRPQINPNRLIPLSDVKVDPG